MQQLVQSRYPDLVKEQMGEMHRRKLGIASWSDEAEIAIWRPLQSLMTRSAVDYTILFRQLSYITGAELADATAAATPPEGAAAPLLAKLAPAFYAEPSQAPSYCMLAALAALAALPTPSLGSRLSALRRNSAASGATGCSSTLRVSRLTAKATESGCRRCASPRLSKKHNV